MKITKDMSITEILRTYPKTVAVFQKFNLGCIGCMAASFETVEDGLRAHQLDVDAVIKELNEAAEQ
ncbi:MAG: DUF1858 domain-containing protein [Candidatus Delongbacteria bacterium]|nr:DUF1858 domain-containing protein [Candidatus Delongbacteria bacterium]MBN2836644.1 DUF1858 domain-containing protein [Candidatus Delongbacteria bacterium]